MKPYKLEFSRFEMLTDNKATGEMKKILQRKVRRQLKKKAQEEIENATVRSQPKDEES